MKTRKLLALVLAIAMIATIFVVPSAAVAPGAACEILGLLEGDGEGVTAEYLAKGTTRAQGLLITLRARGLEDEAKAFTGTGTFTDAADVNADFWGPILAYAYANPDLGWVGDGDGTFRPADVMSGAELAKVMLALLGYTQGVDFEWADIATFAASKGVTVVEGDATNDDLAASLVEALALETTDGSALIDVMIADGVVTEADALAAEVKDAPVVGAFTVAVTGVKTVKATFAEAQDTATAVVSLKKGVVGQAVTVTWDTAKKVATLAKTTNLTKGDYTVTINGEAVDFTVAADETATELVVGATSVYAKAGAQDIKLNLLNQYGEKMTFTAAQIVGGTSLGALAFTADSATLTVAAEDKGKTATIFAYYSPKNFTVNATITVVEDQKLSSIVFSGPIAQGDASKAYTRLTAGTAGNTLAFKALDQYGNTLNLTSYVRDTDYSLVVSGATAGVTDGKLTLTGLTAGTFSVRAIVMATGSVSEMYTETVYAVPALASFDVTVPDALYATAAADFVIAGVDQYGKAIAVDSSILTITPLSTTVTSVLPRVDASNKVTLTFNAKGTADLYFTTGALTVSKAISVQAAKEVASIVSIPVTTQALLVGKAITLDTTEVVLNDQYGNKIAIPAGWNWELRRLAETNVYGVVSTGTDATALTLAGMTITAQKAGAEQLRLTLSNEPYGATTTTYKEFTYDFALSAVAASAVVAYELNIADTMYAGAVSPAHNLPITLVGKTANGTTVTLSSTGDTALPAIVAQYTVTGANVAIVATASNLTTVAGVSADTTAVVKAWNNAGVVVAEKTVALKKAAPVVTTVTMSYTASSSTVAVAAKDQYGVTIATPAGNFYSSDTTKLTVDAAGLVTRVPATATTAIIRFVSNDGVWAREVSVTK